MTKLYTGWRYRLRIKARYWFSKWPIADALNHLQRTCWSDLVTWALHERSNDRDENEYHRLRSQLSGGERCREESIEHPDHTCYCGKFANGCLRTKDAS